MAAPSAFVLVHAVFRAVVTLGLVGVPGFLAGFTGAVNRDFLQRLSRFQVTFLMPSLAFSTFGSRFTLEAFRRVWPLSFWSLVQVVLGICLARLILCGRRGARFALRGSEGWATLLQLAIAFQNIGVFNFPLVMALCSTSGLFDKDKDQCYGDGVLMIFGYHIPWDLALWTHGYASIMALAQKSGEPLTLGNCGNREAATRGIGGILQDLVSHCMNPMLMAMMSGIAVGLCRPLHDLLFGSAALFGPVGDALKQLGSTAPVIGMQILSGTLGYAMGQAGIGADAPKDARGEQRSWMIAVLSGKLLLMPMIAFSIFSFLCSLQRLQFEDAASIFLDTFVPLADSIWPSDKLLRAVVVMQWSAPTCLNIAVLCHRARIPDGLVQALSSMYLAMYGLTALSTTFWVAAGLSLF